MSGGSGDQARGLPNGIKTRDELRIQIEKHGSLAESEVLAHINKSAKPVWTHNDFVNFFQKSGQMVFQVRSNRLYLALSDHESSDDEPCGMQGPISVRNQSQNSGMVQTRNLSDSFSRGITGLGSNGTPNSGSGSSDRRKEPRLAARPALSSSSSDEDNNRSSGHRKPGSSGFSRAQPVSLSRPPPGFTIRTEFEAIPYGSDEDEAEAPRLKSKEEVLKLVNSKRRYYRSNVDADKMVTMDPDPSNKIVPKIDLGTAGDDDSSDDSDDESSDSDRRPQLSRIQPPPVVQMPQASLQGGNVNEQNKESDDSESSAESPAAPRVQPELGARKRTFRDEFFAVKEDNDFRESRERNPEKVLRDVMSHGEVPKADAERYFKYFVMLQGSCIDYLSNGQLVAGILSLIEADADREMLRRIRETDEMQQGDSTSIR